MHRLWFWDWFNKLQFKLQFKHQFQDVEWWEPIPDQEHTLGEGWGFGVSWESRVSRISIDVVSTQHEVLGHHLTTEYPLSLEGAEGGEEYSYNHGYNHGHDLSRL